MTDVTHKIWYDEELDFPLIYPTAESELWAEGEGTDGRGRKMLPDDDSYDTQIHELYVGRELSLSNISQRLEKSVYFVKKRLNILNVGLKKQGYRR